MILIESERLTLRRMNLQDAPFILELLNQENFIRHIGDKGVRSAADARDYISNGPLDSYRRHGFGLYLAALREGGAPIGICGLVKRDWLDDADVGFALLPQFTSRGYATESAAAVLAYGRGALGLKRIVAIVAPDNHASIAVIEKIGLSFEGMISPTDESHELKLFGPARRPEEL